MLKQIIKIYQERSLREKFLLQGFIVILFLIWTQLFIEKSIKWNNDRKSASIELETQQRWLDREIQYAEALPNALKKVEPSKTFSAAQLSGRIDAIIRSIKLEEKTDIDPVQTRIGEIFNDSDELNGISISPKKEFNIIKIWIKNDDFDYSKHFEKLSDYLDLDNVLYKKHDIH